MKRYTVQLLLLTALVGQGCLGMEKMFYERELVEIKEPEPQPEVPPKLMTQADVTEENTAQIIAAMNAELDRAMSEPVAQPATAHVQPRP